MGSQDCRSSYTQIPERPLATIERVLDVRPIDGADKIEVVRVLGWDVVVLKDEGHKIGDLCIYCQIDSVLPPENWCSFLEDRKYRIKTIKLRKQVSQGIIFPLETLWKNTSVTKEEALELKEGEDVTSIMNILQYVPPEARIASVTARYLPKNGKRLTLWQKIMNYFFARKQVKLNIKLRFPTNLVPKTSETRIQNSPSILTNHKGDLVSWTEKVDGMSMTIVWKDRKYKLYTRNWQVSVEKNGADKVVLYESAFKNEHMLDKLLKIKGNYAIQGEIVGPGIDGSGKKTNIYDLPEIQMFVFNVFNIDEQRYLNYFEFLEFTSKYKLRTVPMLGNINLPGTIEEMVKLSEGKSKINPKITREGVVVRSRDMRTGNWDFSFKCISPKYQLKHEE